MSKDKIKGSYRLLRKLGSGASAQVYLAEDPHGNRRVALKVLSLGPKTDPILLEAIKNEFHTLTQLHHPHLARVYDLSVLERELLLSEEWIEGPDLLSFSAGANLNTLFQMVVQLLRALDYLHQRGFLHLDLKPENILVTDPNQRGVLSLKLIDFGLAQRRDRGELHEDSLSGTFPYVAPEILLGRPASPASDLYSLAMILYRLFSGKFPFASQDPGVIFQEQLYGHQTQAHPLHPALPEAWGDYLLQVLQKDPQARPQSAREFLAAMNQALGEDYPLRSPQTPMEILPASDFLFYPELLEKLKGIAEKPQNGLWFLKGSCGSGKRYLLSKLKEALQLSGAHPLWLADPEAARTFLTARPFPGSHLIVPGDSWEEAGETLPWDQLAGLGIPVWVSGNQVPPLPLAGTVELSGAEARLPDFFAAELADFPKEVVQVLQGSFGDSLGELSRWLEASRDLAWIHWGAQGWTWKGPSEDEARKAVDLAEVLWETRWRKVKEILQHGPSGLSGKVLAGLLHVEEQNLLQRLEAWLRQGRLERRDGDGAHLYFLPTETDLRPKTPPAESESWWLHQLQDLYRSGRYVSAIRWLETLPAPEVASDAVRLWWARHQVALGQPAQALATLPREDPAELRDLGLHHEIQSRAHLLLGHGDTCLAQCNEAMVAFQKARDPAGEARIHNLRALLAKRKGEWVQAEDLLKKALESAAPAGDPNLTGSLAMNLANWHFDRGNYERARDFYHQALAALDPERHEHLWSVLQHNWVNFLFHSGQSAEATRACFDWMDHALTHGLVEKQAAALNYLSLLAEQEQATLEQGRYLNQALNLLEGLQESSTPHLYPQILLNRAHWHFSEKNYLPAQLDAEGALEKARNLNHRALEAGAHIVLSRILRRRRRPDLPAAETHLQRALKLIQEQHLRQMLWEVEYELGELARERQDRETARSHLDKAAQALALMLKNMNPDYRRFFLRDRKEEKIQAALAATREQS